MANDQQNRSLLDQLTDAAAAPQPGIPPALAGATADGTPTPSMLSLASAPATTAGSTNNLESIAASPDTLSSRVAATAQSEQNDEKAANDKAQSDDAAAKQANPSFLAKLGRMAGGTFGLESPNSSPQAATGAKIGGLLGRIGNGLAMASGTPEQKQIASEQAQLPLKLAQLQAENRYRDALIGNSANKNNISQDKNKADEALKQQAVDSAYLKQNMVPDELHPGMHRPATADETLANPYLQQNDDMRTAATNLKAAQSQLAQARQQALTNPNSQTQQNFLKTLEEKERIADAQLALAGRRLQMSQQSQDRENFRDLQNLGMDSTGRTLNPGNAAPFMTTDNSGNPIPNKQAPAFKPTGGAHGRADQASVIVDAGEKLVSDIKAHADQIGPLASRYNNIEQFIGNPPPEYKGLAAELESWIALHPAAHGFRGLNAVQEFQKAFGPIAMTPDALIAGIRGSYNTMGALERAGKPSNTGPAKSSPTSAPNAAQNNVVEYVRGSDGKLHPKGQ